MYISPRVHRALSYAMTRIIIYLDSAQIVKQKIRPSLRQSSMDISASY